MWAHKRTHQHYHHCTYFDTRCTLSDVVPVAYRTNATLFCCPQYSNGILFVFWHSVSRFLLFESYIKRYSCECRFNSSLSFLINWFPFCSFQFICTRFFCQTSCHCIWIAMWTFFPDNWTVRGLTTVFRFCSTSRFSGDWRKLIKLGGTKAKSGITSSLNR
jgi:hypothetical protein